ncbi:DNA polymerase [Leptolyngbya sp. 7M]|uniref:DNA polymerase n=1 Tax=Leptolyngbya sp. 7M TaxID=2812896 RepID=UPI001B8D2533|nr:DNA polymerase [Leptolyngbya sp. 7M]QYO66606.1 hypothetical protein JVX88_07335 [Leptolyngbya sp. 7M]
MEVYYQLIRSDQELSRACEELSQSNVLGLDTETSELDPRDGILRLLQLSNGEQTYVFDLLAFAEMGDLRSNKALAPLRDLLANDRQIKVLHNAKFDAKWISHHLGCELGKCFDTYLASILIAAGGSDRRHSLADVAQFFTGIELDKTEQVSDWTQRDLSASQIEYAARDAKILLPLYEQMAERLRNDGLEKAAEIEFSCVTPIAEMELAGFFLDRERWLGQLERVQLSRNAVSEDLQEMLSAGVSQNSLFGRAEINLDSQPQVATALANIGVPIQDTTKAWQLQPLAEKYPVIDKLLQYRAIQKAITSYGENILEYVNDETGRIHADFRQIGAPTGRFSCSNPNLQQIPHDDAYRRCFRAEPGNKLIVADYSQIELRILAEFSGDPQFIDSFVSGKDLHSMTAAQVFGVEQDAVTPDQRSFAKRLNFGIVYGVGASRFGMMTGLSTSEAENMMRRYFGTFRMLDAYLRESGSTVIKDRIARTASGRMLKLTFDENDKQQVGAARRYGVNMPIQGTSADILKRALRLFHDQIAGTSAKIVNTVHDEIVAECRVDEAKTVSEILRNTMVQAGTEFIKKTPIAVEIRVSDDWSKSN